MADAEFMVENYSEAQNQGIWDDEHLMDLDDDLNDTSVLDCIDNIKTIEIPF